MADPILLTPGQSVSQEDMDAVALQHGRGQSGPAAIKSVEKLDPTTDPKLKPLLAEDGLDLQQTPVYRYHYVDGTTTDAITGNDGKFRIVSYQPSQIFQQQQAKEAQSQTPAAQDAAELLRQKRANAALPKDQDPAYETDEERRNRAASTIKQQGADAAAAEARARQAKIDEQNAANTAADNKRADDAAAQAAAARNRPTVTLTQDGTKAVIVYPDGHVTTTSTGLASATDIKQDKDGNWVATGKDAQGNPTVKIVQVQGQTGTTAGLSAPQIVLGHSQDQLTAYGNSLQQEVAAGRMTQARADTLWTQAHQTAQVAIQEATLAQNEAESSRNAQVTLANNRLSNATTGFNAALAAVDKINGTLPEGSNLGGKAFVAMLGLAMMQAQRMGAYDVNVQPSVNAATPGQQRPAPYVPTAPELAPSNVAATTATTDAQVARLMAPSQSVSAPAVATPTTSPSNGASTGMTPPATPSVPYVPPMQNGVPTTNPATGEPTGLTGASEAPMTQATQPPSTPGYGSPDMHVLPPPDAPGNEQSDDWLTVQAADGSQSMIRRSEWDGTGMVVNAQNGATITPTTQRFNDPADPDLGAPMGRGSPSGDYPVLAGVQAPSTPAPMFAPPTMPNQMTPGAPLPAILHADAASKPLWRMSPDEIAQYQAAGVPWDVIERTPGVAA